MLCWRLIPAVCRPVFAYALDQYVSAWRQSRFSGRPLFGMSTCAQGYAPGRAEMGEYLKTWGIDYHAERVAGDVLRGERVKGGDGRYRVYPLWFWAKGEDGRPLRFHTPGSLLAAENFAICIFGIAATAARAATLRRKKPLRVENAGHSRL